ncbi:MAG: substrate-binding domain-containing protein [Flavobacteriales bacterium]
MRYASPFPCSSIAVLLTSCTAPAPENKVELGTTLSGTISISGAFALYPLAVKWGEEFKKLHPEVRFDVQGGGAGKGMTDLLSGNVQLGMISREINAEEVTKGAFGFAVAKDAVLPTINPANPHLAELQAKGLTKDDLIAVWITGKAKTWGDLTGGPGAEVISVHTRSDAAGAPETWAKYLGGAQEDLKGVGVFGDPGLAEAVGKDPLAIGFNNVNYVYDIHTRKPHPTLAVAPIDVNGSGAIEPEENFYADLDQLNKAIVEGKYPSPPARPLYFASLHKPTDPLLVAFLNWVLNDGQVFVQENGYVPLPESVINEQRVKLKDTGAASAM